MGELEQEIQLAKRRAAFERLALPLAPKLRAAARRWCSHAAAADDAVQETYLRAYRTFDAFVPGTNARAWLFTILYSVCANERERMRLRDYSSLAEAPEEVLADPAAADFSFAALAAGEIHRELDALPEPFRSAIVLVDIAELSYDEAARAAGCAIGTLRSRLSRGRRALAGRLAHLAPVLRGRA
ncbi:MAG TPA: RNA polymerase sigma factor [Myxococcota bacterium]|nr:RNA polymerase sigma factor [Myxococcota bacterium]